MIRNYILIAIRALMRRKLYSFINLFGLSVAFAFSTLIYLFVQDERSFDQFHEKKNQIYLVHSWSFNNSDYEKGDSWPYRKSGNIRRQVSDQLKEELPEINLLTPFVTTKGILQYGEETTFQDITLINSDFFSIFSHQVIAGTLTNIFLDESDLVLTSTTARRLFGDNDPIGKQVKLNMLSGNPAGTLAMNVVAVLETPPSTSSLPFEILISHKNNTLFSVFSGRYPFPISTFVEIADGADLSAFQNKLNSVNNTYSERAINATRERQNVPEHLAVEELGLTSINNIHFDKDLNWEKVSDPRYAWILVGLALLIMCISCSNYIIIALTSSAGRRKEVGIRKVIGANRWQLVSQFGFESILLAGTSSVMGLILASLFLPTFNTFTRKGIILSFEVAANALIIIALVAIIIGIVAGSYPSLLLSGSKPNSILKGTSVSKIGMGFAKPLVGFQFFISAIMIVSCLAMYNQLAYVYRKDLGYNDDQIVKVQMNSGAAPVRELAQSIRTFRQVAADDPLINGVAGISSFEGEGLFDARRLSLAVGDTEFSVSRLDMDEFTIPLLSIEIVEGRNFTSNGADQNLRQAMVNETFVKEMGWTGALNRTIAQIGTQIEYEVIGVVKDFHYASLEQPIEPLLLTADQPTTMLIKISGNNIPESLNRISEIWKGQFPGKPLIYTFLDTEIGQQYESYQRWTNITGLATVFGIIIACLGLFGLAGINTVNRTKEIGIRKVLGATLINIFVLLNKGYVLLTFISFAFAIPITVYVMDHWWLNLFAYSIEIGWDLLGIGLLTAFAIVLATVSYHAMKAALINPAATLKDE